MSGEARLSVATARRLVIALGLICCAGYRMDQWTPSLGPAESAGYFSESSVIAFVEPRATCAGSKRHRRALASVSPDDGCRVQRANWRMCKRPLGALNNIRPPSSVRSSRATRASSTTLEQRRADYALLLLQQAPAIDRLIYLDSNGRERAAVDAPETVIDSVWTILSIHRFQLRVRAFGAWLGRPSILMAASFRGSWIPRTQAKQGGSKSQKSISISWAISSIQARSTATPMLMLLTRRGVVLLADSNASRLLGTGSYKPSSSRRSPQSNRRVGNGWTGSWWALGAEWRGRNSGDESDVLSERPLSAVLQPCIVCFTGPPGYWRCASSSASLPARCWHVASSPPFGRYRTARGNWKAATLTIASRCKPRMRSGRLPSNSIGWPTSSRIPTNN